MLARCVARVSGLPRSGKRNLRRRHKLRTYLDNMKVLARYAARASGLPRSGNLGLRRRHKLRTYLDNM